MINCPTGLLAKLKTFANSRAVDIEALLLQSGFSSNDRSIDGMEVPFEAFQSLLESCASACGDDAFGLSFGDSIAGAKIDLMYYLMANSPTARDALQTRIRYRKLLPVPEEVSLELADGGERFIWQFGGEAPAKPQYTGFLMAILAGKIRSILDSDWLPLDATIEHAEPRTVRHYQRVLGPNIAFNDTQTSILIGNTSLDRKLPQADLVLYGQLIAAAHAILDQSQSSDAFTDLVAGKIAVALTMEGATVAGISSLLGMSPRTFQRQLTASGTTFGQLLDKTRKDMAMHYLTQSDLSFTEIAFLLGFSESSAFSRAVRLWFDMTPSEIRQFHK
jgi:AraC-like DNA-binding protein